MNQPTHASTQARSVWRDDLRVVLVPAAHLACARSGEHTRLACDVGRSARHSDCTPPVSPRPDPRRSGIARSRALPDRPLSPPPRLHNLLTKLPARSSAFALLSALIAFATSACEPSSSRPDVTSAHASASSHTEYTYTVVNSYPHDPAAFTQGLQYIGNGQLLEGTGQVGKSSLRRVDLQTGNVLKRINLPAPFFGEGVAALGDRIYQLTWQHQKGFVYDLATLSPLREFTYTGEGWGLTTDGRSLILSDGTATIRFLNPETFAVTRTIDVTLDGRPIPRLNELEFIDGEIVANIWQTPSIVRIDPATGRVTAVIDLSGILPASQRKPDTDVLNGIAYDPATKRLFVTGKNWPLLFEIKLLPKSP